MGWSCSAAADDVMNAWTRACAAQTGFANAFEIDGDRYYWEPSHKEHDDGAITGSIVKVLSTSPDGSSRCRAIAPFRIDGDGTVVRAPTFLRAVAA